uniref:Ycf34 n=1 Tax=Helminthocladia australis TaxID=260093 RepID=A0A1G4NTC4_9FLOR|nr:Hypothetical protein ycf34 [Helminthocladia australis]SCW21932.1 Hypothetical protein ycf34 [Helminthocladia australis]
MCICINCLYVHKCSTYKFIRKQHDRVTNEYQAIFDPIHPIIYANFSHQTQKVQVDWDVVECSSFLEKPGYWKQSETKTIS